MELDIKSLNFFEKNYIFQKNILKTQDFELSLYTSKINNEKVIIKEYKEDFTKMQNIIIDYGFLINKEYKLLLECKNCKNIIQVKDALYSSINKAILVYDYFDLTLKNIKQKLTIDEIRCLLFQINDAIQELDKLKINNIIISPENIGLIKNLYFYKIKLINLFPYYELKDNYEFLKYRAPEDLFKYYDYDNYYFDNTIKNNINLSTISILWNIGVFVYELYFNELPYEKKDNKVKIKSLKSTISKDLDNLLENLLKIDTYERIKWDQYVNHKFFKGFEAEKKFTLFNQTEVNESLMGINLKSKLKFTKIDSFLNLNNIFWINLSENQIENFEFIKGNVFKNINILILENNIIKDINFELNLTFTRNIE